MHMGRKGKSHVWRLNYDSHMISGCRTPRMRGIPWVRDLLKWLAETLDPGKFPGPKGELTQPSEFKRYISLNP